MARRLNLDDVVVVGDNKDLVLASAPSRAAEVAAEVDALESRLWIKLPSGYREYMERLGEGYLGNLRIYSPSEIEEGLVEWRRWIRKYWMWDESPELLPKNRALECVIIGDTGGGDELIFHPCRPDRLFLLPHGAEKAFEAGSDLLEAIEWVCSSGHVGEAFPEREFEPFDVRPSDSEERVETKPVADPEGDGLSLDEIMQLCKHWAETHSTEGDHSNEVEMVARLWSRTHEGREVSIDKLETELILEAIVISGAVNYSEGHLRKYAVIDSQSGSRLGEFLITNGGESYPDSGSVYPLGGVVPAGGILRSPVVEASSGPS